MTHPDFLLLKPKNSYSLDFYQGLWALNPNFKNLEYLLSKGADINYTPYVLSNNFVAVFYDYKGSEDNKIKLLNFLKNKGFDIQGSRHEPGNALNFGLSRRHITLPQIKTLFDLGVDPLAKNYYGIDSFSLALNCGKSEAFLYMTELIGPQKIEPCLPHYENILKLTPIDDTIKNDMLDFLRSYQEKLKLSKNVEKPILEEGFVKKMVSKL